MIVSVFHLHHICDVAYVAFIPFNADMACSCTPGSNFECLNKCLMPRFSLKNIIEQVNGISKHGGTIGFMPE